MGETSRGPRTVRYSIIVPTHRRPEQLSACLLALAALRDVDGEFEVIVANDGGGSPCPRIDDFASRLPLSVVDTAVPHSGPSAARNLGVEQANGELLVFVDDDCRPADGWLRGIAERAVQNPGCLVGGRTLNGCPDSLCSTASELTVQVGYAQNNRDPDSATWFASNNLAVPASLFRAIGGFDSAIRTGEDTDLCDRWQALGHRMVYAPEAVVIHDRVLGFRAFCRQHFVNGRGLFHHRRAHRRRWRRSRRIEPTYYVALARTALRSAAGVRGVAVLTFVGLAQVLNLMGYCYEART